MKDKFNREIDYLRISFTDNCNLRCIYCMEENNNSFFNSTNMLTDDEIIRIVNQFAKLGIKKIRITGGEPLIRPGALELISRLSKIDGIEEIYLTTNGILLYDKLDDLVKYGIKGVNISLDTVKEDRFKILTRRKGVKDVLASIDKSIELGLKVKINTVIVDDINKDEIIDFANLTINKSIDLRFIELMPIGIGKKFLGTSNKEILKLINSEFKEIKILSRENGGGPADYIKIKEAKGKIGFISPMSNCFCEDCNRIRLTPEGFLKQCLHFNYGVDLKRIIRNGISDFELNEIIKRNIFEKPEKHLFGERSINKDIRNMNQIGG